MELSTTRHTTSFEQLDSFPTFYRTQRFITKFTWALHLLLSWARPIQSTSPHLTSSRSSLILSTHLRLGLPSSFFLSGYRINNLYTFLFSPFVLHAPTISTSLTWLFWLHLAKGTSQEAPCYTVFSTLPSPHPSAPCSQTSSVHTHPLMPDTKFHTHTEPQYVYIKM
jgi:hypothetical protein